MPKIVDRFGETYLLEISSCPPYLFLLVTDGSLPIARVKFNLVDITAELIDIVVNKDIPTRIGWRSTFLRRPRLKSYRGCGLGSALLISSLPELKKQGIKTVWGIAEHRGLKSFYERIGFTFNEQTKNITMDL